MKCIKCGYDLEIGWRVCPTCANPIKNKNKLFLILGIILSIIIIPILTIYINNYNSTGERGIKRHLEKKYNEKFDEIILVKTAKNPDTTLSCDGANFGTIKGKGDTQYYKVYSKQNDIEFTAHYDTHTKDYQDTYSYKLNVIHSTQKLYTKTKKTLNTYVDKITFSPDIHDETVTPSPIYSTQDFKNILNKVQSEYSPNNYEGAYTRLLVHVNVNSLEFCKTEYNNILMLNNYLIELEQSTELYSQIGLLVYTRDNVQLNFNRLDNNVYIYDEFANDKVWGEPINEFVKRDNY